MNNETKIILTKQQLSIANGSARWLTVVKITATSIGLFLRLTASFVAAAYQGWLRKQNSFIIKVKELFVASSVVVLTSRFFSSSLTEEVIHRNNKLEFIYQVISKPITSCRTSIRWFPRKSISEKAVIRELEPEECVHVDVLYDPSPDSIQADIIFIHGLHGSLYNTWKQGLWSYRKQVQSLPLEHKYKVKENSDIEYSTKFAKINTKEINGKEKKHGKVESIGQYDHLLENITDLLNNIDDTIKGSNNEIVESDEPYSPCWPRDWLPKDCPNVRVIAVNYTTDPFLWRPVWISKRIRSSMTQRSLQMENILLELGVGEFPVIWVGHSKGGLFIKQMLVDARQSDNPKLSKFLPQTKGIMFYSVPHRGSSLANWNLPLCKKSVELTEVKKDCEEVLDLHKKFLKLYEEKSLTAEVFSFVETILTFMFVTNVRIVSVDSADLGLGSFRGVNIDHREICKPLNRNCFLYKELTSLITRVLKSSPD